jgi:hypothetical protein
MPVSIAVRRFAAAAAAAGLALGASAGCASQQAMPTVDFPSASTGVQLVGQLPVAAAPSFSGYAPPLDAITVKLSGLAAGARFSYPMDWLSFTATIANTSGFAFHGLDPLVVFGQCTCSPADHHIAPSTSLQVWNASAGTWKGISPSDINSKGVYKFSGQLGSIDLGPNATVTYKYRVALSRTTARQTGLVDGTGSLNMYVLQLPGHTRLTASLDPEATVPISYAFNTASH